MCRHKLRSLNERAEVSIFLSVGLLFFLTVIIPVWKGLLEIEFWMMLLPLLSFLSCVLFDLLGKHGGARHSSIGLKIALYLSCSMLLLASIAGFYFYLGQTQQGYSLYHVSSGPEISSVNDVLDRSIEGLLIGALMGIIIVAAGPILVRLCSSIPRFRSPELLRSQQAETPKRFYSGLIGLLRDSLLYGLPYLAVIYFLAWPGKILICEPHGFPLFAEAFVGLLSLSTIIPGILRILRPSSRLYKSIRAGFRWFDPPRTVSDSIRIIPWVLAVIYSVMAFWNRCFVQSGFGSVAATTALFVMFSFLTVAPALLAVFGASFLIESFGSSALTIGRYRRAGGLILAAIAAYFVLFPLPFYTIINELLGLALRSVGIDLISPVLPAFVFPLGVLVLVLLAFLTYRPPHVAKGLAVFLAGGLVTLLALRQFAWVYSSFGVSWLPVVVALDFGIVVHTLVHLLKRPLRMPLRHIKVIEPFWLRIGYPFRDNLEEVSVLG
jgi:hypothetical protein